MLDSKKEATRTNIVLDKSLVRKAKTATGLKTIREVIHYALKELLRRERQKNILRLRGKIHWRGNLSQMRRSREFR